MDYDSIIASRCSDAWDVFFCTYVGYGTVVNNWYGEGLYSGGGYTAPDIGIPGGGYLAPGMALNGAFGGLPIGVPTSGKQRYIVSAGAWATANSATPAFSALMFYDLLWWMHFDTCTSGTLTINSQTANAFGCLSRYTDGVGVKIAVASLASIGSTPSNIQVNYTNEAGNSGRNTVSQAMTPSAKFGQYMPSGARMWLPLQAGDMGVQSIQSLTLSAGMGGAGPLYANLQLIRPLFMIPFVHGYECHEVDITRIPEGPILLPTDSLLAPTGGVGCIQVAGLMQLSATTNFHGMVRTVCL